MEDKDKLYVYILFDHPVDIPGYYVVRRFLMDQPEEKFIFLSDDLEVVRFLMENVLGKAFLYRHEKDDPKIMGTYI